MHRKRVVLGVAVAAAAATVLAACSSSGSSSTSSNSSSSSAKVTLSWWNNANTQPLLGVFNNVIKQFEAAHPNITIQNVPMQNEQFKTKVTPALRGNAPPDIYQQWGSGQQATQVQSGKVADISSQVISVDRLARHPGDRVADQREVVRRPLRPARGRLLVPQGPVPAGGHHLPADDHPSA